MAEIHLIKHAPGAPGLRLLGLGPHLAPSNGIKQLQKLFETHAFWASNRNPRVIKKLLAHSSVVVTIWLDQRLIGFGRATSDSICRAVLWDIVVEESLQGKGIGRMVVDSLVNSSTIKNVEKVYLMTTNSQEFYTQVGFDPVKDQCLLIKKHISS